MARVYRQITGCPCVWPGYIWGHGKQEIARHQRLIPVNALQTTNYPGRLPERSNCEF